MTRTEKIIVGGYATIVLVIVLVWFANKAVNIKMYRECMKAPEVEVRAGCKYIL